MRADITVMIIDDDADDILMFTEALSEVDSYIGCIAANTCEAALELLHQEDSKLPDYIFLDINMPRMNGIQCLKELKKHAKLAKIPVIMYSTAKRKEDFEASANLGAMRFLIKPSNYADLKRMLHNFFTESQSQQQSIVPSSN